MRLSASVADTIPKFQYHLLQLKEHCLTSPPRLSIWLSFLSIKDSNEKMKVSLMFIHQYRHSPISPPSRNRHFQKYQSIFPSLLFYARFGMAICITLCLNIIANTIETIENNTADTNIMLNDAADGKYCAIP